MVADEKIRNEIKDRVEKISSDKLNSLHEYIKELELSKKHGKSDILKYFGIWRDIDDELFDEFTENLPKKRLEESKEHL